MSWELSKTSKITCPCGKGYIIQEHFDDDWNRTKKDSPVIQCEECKSKYVIEEETYSNPYKWESGTITTYYLTPVDYPKYIGISEEKEYGNSHNNVYDLPFHMYLIENYSYQDLKESIEEYESKKFSSKVSGIAKRICDDHKRRFKTTKTKLVVEQLNRAINEYLTYFGTYDQRIIVRLHEEQERKKYVDEKRIHQIKLDM